MVAGNVLNMTGDITKSGFGWVTLMFGSCSGHTFETVRMTAPRLWRGQCYQIAQQTATK